MKRGSRRASAALCKACPAALSCWSLLAAVGVVEAALYWDINGASPGAGGANPSGNWDNATANWSADPTGGSPTQSWTSGESAVFSAGSDATGQFTVTVAGTQVASGLTFLTGQPVLAGNTIQLTGATPTINTPAGVNAVIQLALGGNAGILFTGGGLTALATANTYSGATTINAGGDVDLKHSQALGASSGVSVGSGSALLIDGSGLSIPRPITSLNGDGPTTAGALRNVFGDNTYAGNIIVGAGGARIGSDAGTFTLAGTMNGAGTLTLQGSGNFNLTGSIQNPNGINKAGLGTLTLTASSTSAGVWALVAGTTKLAASERIADTASIKFDEPPATFDMGGFNETVGSISGTGKIVNDNGNLTVGGDGTSTTFGGTITGSGTLTKIGSGTLSLRGENLYSGVTTISAGAISLGSLGRVGTSTTGTVVAPGASLILLDNVVVREPITISGNGVNNAGAVGRSGADSATYAGPITLAAPSRIGAQSTLIVSGNTNNSGFDLTVGGTGLISFSGAISGAGGLVKDGTNIVLLLSSANTYGGNTTATAGKLIVNGSLLSSPITVNSGATLGGSGIISKPVTINTGGHIAPGPAVGGVATIDLVELTLLSHSMLDFELATPNVSDKIAMPKSTLHLSGQEFSDFVFTKLGGFTPGEFVLIDTGSIDGSLGPNTSGFIGTTPATIAIQGNDLVLLAPEPTGAALAAVGLTLLAARRRARD